MTSTTPNGGSRLLLHAVVFLLAMGLAGAAVWYFLLSDRTPPELTLTPEAIMVSKHLRFEIHAEDADSPLTRLTVTAILHGESFPVLDQVLDTGGMAVDAAFTLERLPLNSGDVVLEVAVTDGSIANFGSGNTATLTRTCTLDTLAPQLFIQSLEHNLTRGGAGAIAFQASEEIVNAGVALKDTDIFFPAFKQANGDWVCLFAFPYFMDPADFSPVLTAQDPAGNSVEEEFYFTAAPAVFRERTIDVPESFLEDKVPEFPEYILPGENMVQSYVRINNELRDVNQETLYQAARDTSPTPLWSGAFLRMAKTEPTALFGDQRTYVFQGETIDFQVHLGVDLASVRNDDVPAANNGTVVFADTLGIYGRAVVLDHGMGLQTLYAHLSGIMVGVGDFAEQGQILGKTGTTGLAGGDHLHFGILIGGIAVNPIEWWDAHWIEVNVANRLQ